ncbi:MAG: hypothetical protein ABL888_01790 [Pirellulaceae bacterium]
MKTNQKLVVALFALLAVAVCQAGFAQVVPFKARGDNAIYSQPFIGGDGSTSSLGKATHMGKVYGEGQALPTVGNNWETVGDYTLTAANGDTIRMNGGGTVDVIPLGGGLFYAVWTGEFNVVGGTGRFANVGPGPAPIAVVAINNPFTFAGPIWTYSWTLTGKINLGKK